MSNCLVWRFYNLEARTLRGNLGDSETGVWTELILSGGPGRSCQGQLVSHGWCSLCVKRLFVLVQAWLCIHSLGLHFLENPPTTTLTCQDSLRLHTETFPCHFHPTLSTARCLPNFSTSPCWVFKGNRPTIAQGGFVKGWGYRKNQTQEGGVPKKGLGIRSRVPGALLSHNSHGLMGTAFTVLSVCHFLITSAKDFTSDRTSWAPMREAFFPPQITSLFQLWEMWPQCKL